jgi:hypothetical protein
MLLHLSSDTTELVYVQYSLALNGEVKLPVNLAAYYFCELWNGAVDTEVEDA